MASSDLYHPKTLWMTQGATHLRCSSGAELWIAAGAQLDVRGQVQIASGADLEVASGGEAEIKSNGLLDMESGSSFIALGGARVYMTSGAIFQNAGVVQSTHTASQAILNANGAYILDCTGVFHLNPTRGSRCRIYIDSTKKRYIKGTSETDAVRFGMDSTKRRVLVLANTSALTKRMLPGVEIIGWSTHQAMVHYLATPSSDLSNESVLAVGAATST